MVWFFVATYRKERFIATFSLGNQLLTRHEIPHLSGNNEENQKKKYSTFY